MLALEREWLASGLPVAALMETVGQRMADWLLAHEELLRSGVVVLVGPGHNGGDGLVVARKLLEAGALGRDERIVLLNTGNGLKYQEFVTETPHDDASAWRLLQSAQ